MKPASSHRTLLRNVLLHIFTLFFLGTQGFAQAANTGTIEGRVQNGVTGRYLNNARISIRDTNLRVFTDESGSFRITNVPAGSQTVEVLYTGLAPQQLAISVTPGQSIRRDVNLNPDNVVQIDPYVIAATRVMDQDVIAINEQRFAPNIKTVVATGELSEHADSNISEFLKSIPGVASRGDTREASELYIRGFPPNLTQITMDGGAIAHPALSANTRTMPVSQELSSDSIARVEITKVPTPSTGADTMAGSVNMITKSAFESSRASFRYQINVAGDHEHISLKKEPGAWNEDMYYMKPSLSFSYTLPVNDRFGIVVTGMYGKRWTPQERYTPAHNTNSPTFGSTIAKPMLSASNYLTAAGNSVRGAIGLKADWRVTKHSILSANVQNYFREFQNSNYQFNRGTGTLATPTIAGGVTGSFGEDYTIGATGRGTLTFGNNFGDRHTVGLRGDIRYTFDNSDWKIDFLTGHSKSRLWVRNIEAGQFNSIAVATTIPFRVEFHDIDPDVGPQEIKVFNNANQLLDVHDPSIHQFTQITEAVSNPRDVSDKVENYKLDVRRRIDFLPFPAFVQVGGTRKEQLRDFVVRNSRYTFRGINGSLSPLPFVTQYEELRYDPAKRQPPLISPHKAVAMWKNDPGLFFQTPAQVAAGVQAQRLNSELIEETNDALYFQAEGRFFEGRLNVLGGVRYERTSGKGAGSLNTPNEVFLRNADGSFALTPTGARIRSPAAGAAGSLQEIELTWHERAAKSSRSYDGYYPSLHLNYNITEKLIARAAYAETYGRPDFSFIIPRTVVNESTDADGDVIGGLLTVRNAGLLPWTASNYDLSLEYYTDKGGVVSGGLFRKNISGFFGAVDVDASPEDLREAGLDPNLAGWKIRTTRNIGDARVDGVELNINQSLSVLNPWLGGWGQYFRVFANGTKLKITGEGAEEFTGFVPTSINWGFQFRQKRFGGSLKWNYRSEEVFANVTNIGANGINYFPARTHLDVNLSYSFRPNLSIFGNFRNVANKKVQRLKRSDDLPDYARMINITNFGIGFNLGINGSF